MTGVPPSVLTIGERILLHLSMHPWVGVAAPYELTQDGIGQALGRTRAHAAVELKKLMTAEMVNERQDHIINGAARRKVYTLTPAGRDRVKRVRAVLAEQGVDWVSVISAPSSPRADLAMLGERITRMQNELDNLKVAFAGLQGGTA